MSAEKGSTSSKFTLIFPEGFDRKSAHLSATNIAKMAGRPIDVVRGNLQFTATPAEEK